MSGNTVGAVVGGTIGFLVGGPAGAQIGFTIGSIVGGIVDPVKIKGPRLADTQTQTAQEGAFIPFGYGSFPVPTQLIWQGPVVEHKQKEGGKGGPVTTTYTYTRSYAIGLCEGPGDLLMLWENGKLVYDIRPTSTIQAQNAKFLERCTIYRGDETQTVDPTIEAIEGVGATGPMRGLMYFVIEDGPTQAGEVAQYRAVVQNCGTLTVSSRHRFINAGGLNKVETSPDGTAWTARTSGLSAGGLELRYLAANGPYIVASSDALVMYYSSDYGVSWTAGQATTRNVSSIAYGNGIFLAVTDGAYFLVSADNGVTWTENAHGLVNTHFAHTVFGVGVFVVHTGPPGASANTYWTTDGASFTLGNGFCSEEQSCFNGVRFLALDPTGASSRTYTSTDGKAWTDSGLAGRFFNNITGGVDYAVANAVAAPYHIWRTTDAGATWTDTGYAGPGTSGACATANGIDIFSVGGNSKVSTDDGVTWVSGGSLSGTVDIVGLFPSPDWYVVPDAPDIYADEDGVIHSEFAASTSLSSCDAVLSDIVEDLCDRGGIDASEIDASALTDYVRGFVCATESSPQALIEVLTQAYFFDRGEWDKKIRFIKRGGASAFALTTDDLVARDGPAIGQTKVQEVELLRKTTVMTIDPAADFSSKPQTWERRISTINARGESTVEVPIVAEADIAKGIAKTRSAIAWAETEKFNFGLTRKWSKLTPTDVGALTDKAGAVHRIRLQDQNEESGVFMVEEAVKDRASVYGQTATGTVTSTPPTTSAELIGPTLLMACNLPQMRTQDGAGLYVGMAGILGGWPGAQLLISYDAGVSYSVALTVTEATTMGTLTASITSSGTPLSVHVFGGSLESKTTAQVAAGANYSAILSGSTAEVVAYETATQTAAVGTSLDYDLTVLTRAVNGTTAASHASADKFMDLATAYFVPIPQDYAGDTLYLKAVAMGISADAVDPITVVFDGATIVYDGGEVTP